MDGLVRARPADGGNPLLDQYGLTQQRGYQRVPAYVAGCGVWYLKGTGPDGQSKRLPFRCGNRLCGDCCRTILRKWTRLTCRGYDAAPGAVRFVTLTCPPWAPTELAWTAFPAWWNHFRILAERQFGKFEYIRAVEATKRGRPHYHLLVRSGYWPVRELSAIAERAGFGSVVWVTRPRDRKRAVSYVLKYILKDVHLPLPNRTRRVARSQGWCPDVPRETLPGWTWELIREPQPGSP